MNLDPCLPCDYSAFLSFSTYHMEKHTSTQHIGKKIKSVKKKKMVSLSKGTSLRQADTLLYSAHLHELAEKGRVVDVPNEEKFQPPLPSSTPADAKDSDSLEANFNAASHLLETARGGMESKPLIKDSPSKAAGGEICSAPVDREGMSSIKQEISIQQLKDSLNGSVDEGASGPRTSSAVQRIDHVKAEFVEKLSIEILSLVQPNNNLVKTKSSHVGVKIEPKYCLLEIDMRVDNNAEENEFHADEHRNVPRCNYEENSKTSKAGDVVPGNDDNDYDYCVEEVESGVKSSDVRSDEASNEHEARKQITENPNSPLQYLNVVRKRLRDHRSCWKCFNKLVFCLGAQNNLSLVGDDSHDVHKPKRSTTINYIRTEEKRCKCNECGKTFSQNSHLHAHMRTHTGEKPFKCNECGKTFSQSCHLHTHMRTHRGGKPFKCEGCGKTFSHSGDLYTHNCEKPFKCNECGKTFSKNHSLHFHMRTHGTGETPFKCTECGKTFSQSCHLHTHIRMRTHIGEKPFKCNACAKTFSKIASLQTHMRTHTAEKPLKCNECAKTFSKIGSLQTHMRTHTGEKPLKCNECGKMFSKIGSLQTHMRTHTGENPLKCNECGKTLSTNSSLQIHVRTHTGEKPFKCKECGKTFRQSCHLHSHIRTHRGEKPFKCKECGKTFSNNGRLRTHNCEKPFKCKECGKTFGKSNILYFHMRTHTGERPCKCKYCYKTFSQNSTLHNHLRTHTGERPFKCKECGKTFNRRDTLHMHMRAHTGERPFTCKECGKTFSRGNNLHTHLRIHTGEKPFKCKECGNTFSRGRSLRTHMRRHTGEKPFKRIECGSGRTFSKTVSLQTHIRTHAEEKPFIECDESDIIVIRRLIAVVNSIGT